MRPDLRVVSVALPKSEFAELERVCKELSLSRSDVLRKAISEFIAVHDYKMFLASLNAEDWARTLQDLRVYIDAIDPTKRSDITEIGGNLRGAETSPSPRIEIEGGEARE